MAPFHVADRVRILREDLYKGREGVILRVNPEGTFAVKTDVEGALPVNDLMPNVLEKLPLQPRGRALEAQAASVMRAWIAAHGGDHRLVHPEHCLTCETNDLIRRIEKSK